jgi:hypothetical protein
MSEILETIRQLKTDIATLINAIKTVKRHRIVGTEAIDPLWQSIDHYRKQIMELKEIRYEQVEKELAERPIVWCLKDSTGQPFQIETEHGPMVALYPSKKYARIFAKKDFAVFPYEDKDEDIKNA